MEGFSYTSTEYDLVREEGSAGYDICSVEDISLDDGCQKAIKTGIRVEIPIGQVGILKDKSSMAKRGLYVTGGVIDSSYRGEILVLLLNNSGMQIDIKKGQKICQMIVISHSLSATKVEFLSETKRGEGGFGSTGAFYSQNN